MRRLLPVLLLCVAIPAFGQSLDPRAFVNTPVGMNFAIGAYAYSTGNVLFDPAVPLTNAYLELQGPIAGYARALDLWGLSGKASVVGGVICANGHADLDNVRKDRSVCGMIDPAISLSVNVLGGPALRLPAFRNYKQNFLAGVSLRVTAPLGQYDPTKLVNIGTNRWSFKPEIGLSKAVGRLTAEVLVAATLYTANTDFYGGSLQQQAPLFSGQLNLVYTLRSGIWAALGGTLYGGGRVTTDGVQGATWQENSRLGLTLVFPISRHNSLKAFGSTGVFTRTGTDFDAVSLGWQYRWGGGI